MDFLPADLISKTNEKIIVSITGLGTAELDANQAPTGTTGSLCAGIRPELMTIISSGENTHEHTVNGTIIETQYCGDMTYYDVLLNGYSAPVSVSMRNTSGSKILQKGDTAKIGWGSHSIVLLPA
jgi:spermidine/putrescine transport system ATP-binding protein